MELFFTSSPVGLLQILIKENKLYSLSRIEKSDWTAGRKTKTLNTKNLFRPCDLKVSLNGFSFSNRKLKPFMKTPSNRKLKSLVKTPSNKNSDKDLQKKSKSSNQIQIKPKKLLNSNLSCLINPANFSLLKQQKKSTLAKKIDRQLNLYFEGKLQKFQIPIYNRGTDFQRSVWRALQKIPWGHTKQYHQIAKELKKAKAYRAVGNSCGKNPFLIVVPCHRVLSCSGLGGFALGLQTKKYLLNLEQSH